LEDHLRALVARRVAGAVDAGAGVADRSRGNPYRGLQSFELENAAYFFGRSRARNELREVLAGRIEDGRAFVLVLGASGSGKSSLVKAGLLADLALPGMIGRVALVRHAVLRPSDRGGKPTEALAAAMIQRSEALPERGHAPLDYTVESLAALLRDAPVHAVPPLRQALGQAGRGAGLSAAGEVSVPRLAGPNGGQIPAAAEIPAGRPHRKHGARRAGRAGRGNLHAQPRADSRSGK